MPRINDRDRTIFAEAHNTVLDFNDHELGDISRLALELKKLIEAAKKREQDRVNRTL